MTEENLEEMKKMPKIDMTKVANIDALDADDRNIVKSASKKQEEDSRRKNKRKFNFQEPMKFMLPSHGKFYQDSPDADLRNGFIKLYPLSLADEEILTNRAYLKNGSMFRILFNTCMASNYDAKKLLQFDSLYIMYILRQISYGDDYHFKATCAECGEEFDWDLNISDIEWAELPEDAVDIRDIVLPISHYTVTMQLLRLEAEEQQKFIEKKYKCKERVSALISNTLDIKDENGESINPEDWAEFFEALPAKDRAVINESFKNTRQEPKMTITCPECGNIITVEVPIGEDFFRIQ